MGLEKVRMLDDMYDVAELMGTLTSGGLRAIPLPIVSSEFTLIMKFTSDFLRCQ